MADERGDPRDRDREYKRIQELQDTLYGDRTAEDRRRRDGLARRVDSLEESTERLEAEMKPITMYTNLIATMVRYLGIPGTLGLLVLIFRYLAGDTSGGGP